MAYLRTSSASGVRGALLAGIGVVAALAVVVGLVRHPSGTDRADATSPEQAALLAAQALAGHDWPAYRRLSVTSVDLLHAEAVSHGGRGSSFEDALRPAAEARLRAEFDALVQQRLLNERDLDGLQVVAAKPGPDEWQFDLQDRAGRVLPVSIYVTRLDGRFRVTALEPH